MMTNLFSVFDPTTGILSLNWLSMLSITMIPLNFWNCLSKISLTMNLMMKKLTEEITTNSNKIEPSILFISMFLFIIINNIMGLLPYVFTATSHLIVSIAMAFSMWMSLMLFGWINNTNKMFTHLVPIGTPSILMPFMVLIETVSNLIRPGSLAVRLTANMIAGHLLMTLLGNNLINNFALLLFFMWLFMGLMLFELAVAFIQSYVFMTLSTLYSSEI